LVLSVSSTNSVLVPTNQIVFGGGSSNRMVTVTPATNRFGTTLITVMVHDDAGGTASDTFVVAVSSINDAPVALAQSVTTPEDTATNLVLTASDVDSTNLVFALLSGPTNGVLSLLETNSGALTYTPATNYQGGDVLVFTVSDGSLVATGQVSITVTPVNDAPVANDDSVSTPEDTPVALDPRVNDTDVDGDLLTITEATATNGVVSLLGGTNLVFLPATNFYGVAVISYSISDGHGGTASADVTVTVTAENDLPVAGDDLADTCQGVTLTLPEALLLANDVDVDAGNVLSIINVSPDSSFGGTVGLLAEYITYVPPTNFTGLDTFSYTVTDGQGGSTTGTVTVRVWPPFAIMSISRQVNGSLVIQFCGVQGSNYVLEASSDFTNWSSLGNLSEGTAGVFQFEDATTTGVNTRFYRVLLP